ncbi:MAG: hypothetical protein QXU57_02945, partial [Fervidicoccaceae archaeon]
SREKAKKQLRDFFLLQIPFFLIAFFLIGISVIIGLNETPGFFLFILGAILLVMTPSLSLILLKRKMKKSE